MSSETKTPHQKTSFGIHLSDLWKLVPMTLMLFFICLNYSILRNLKDSVVVTAHASGAEVIPFIKVWFMLPMAVLLTYTFTKLTNRFTQEQVFYIMTSGFLIFYALFAFVLYPHQDVIHPHAFADTVQEFFPKGCMGLIAAFRNWSFTLFYVMSELWSSIVMSVMFWGFANEITKVAQARYFYSVFGVGSNVAAIIAGQFGIYFSRREFNPNLPFGRDAWEQSLMEIVLLVIVLGLSTMGIFRWMNRYVLNDSSYANLHKVAQPLKVKKKLSLRESFSFLSQSRYLICIAVLVVSYNCVINVVEVVWKGLLSQEYPTSADFNFYMSHVTTIVGMISTITALFMPLLIGRMGWTFTAMLTPVIMLVTSLGFFLFFLTRHEVGGVIYQMLGMTPISIAIFFGAAQNCLSKAAKYSVFDTTKEITFIPLDHEVKLKGKAAIDGVGSRLGKSGGSILLQGLLMIFGTLSASAPYIAFILMAVIGLWFSAIRSLGRQFMALTSGNEEADTTPRPEVEVAAG